MGLYPQIAYFPPAAAQSPRHAGVSIQRKEPPVTDMDQIRRSLVGQVLNASRTPIRLESLIGRRDGEPVTAIPPKRERRTRYVSVDNLLWKMEQAGGYMPKFLKNMMTTSVCDGLASGAATTILTGVGVFAMKGLGGFRPYKPANLGAYSIMIGFLGGLAGACGGLAQASWRNIRDLALLVRNPGPEV